MKTGDKDEPWEQPKGVYRYTLDDLKRATSNFSKEHEIGSGGFGKVFSGKFPGNKTLAIKRASISTSANGQTQFRNEVCCNQFPSSFLYQNENIESLESRVIFWSLLWITMGWDGNVFTSMCGHWSYRCCYSAGSITKTLFVWRGFVTKMICK